MSFNSGFKPNWIGWNSSTESSGGFFRTIGSIVGDDTPAPAAALPESASYGIFDGYGCELVYSSDAEVLINTGTFQELITETTIDITSSIAIDFGTAGVNGLGSGLTEAASTLYDVWLIADNAGSNAGGLLTEAGTELSDYIPATHDTQQSIYLGSISNDTGSNIIPFYVVGKNMNRSFHFKEPPSGTNSRVNLLFEDTNATTTIDYSHLTPVSASTAIFEMVVENTGSDGIYSKLSLNGTEYASFSDIFDGLYGNKNSNKRVKLPVCKNNTELTHTISGSVLDISNGVSLWCVGYEYSIKGDHQ